jgi:7-carboxy-7-deazaguanine synthase
MVDTYSVSEIFFSLQGEGQLAGVPSAFVRLAGCELRCRYCDTPYAWDAAAGQPMTLGQIAEQVGRFNRRHIVITGGEPLLADRLNDLIDELRRDNRHVTLETSGITYRSVRCSLVSISPKLSASVTEQNTGTGPADRLDLNAIQRYIYYHEYQLKFVVRDPSELAEVEAVLSKLREIDRGKVYLMPQARTREEYRMYAPAVAAMCLEQGFRFSPRLQLELWDNQRGR